VSIHETTKNPRERVFGSSQPMRKINGASILLYRNGLPKGQSAFPFLALLSIFAREGEKNLILSEPEIVSAIFPTGSADHLKRQVRCEVRIISPRKQVVAYSLGQKLSKIILQQLSGYPVTV
jgi:hypothetical protein